MNNIHNFNIHGSGAPTSKRKSKRKKIIIISLVAIFLIGSGLLISYGVNNKRSLAISSFSVLEKVSKFLPISQDEILSLQKKTISKKLF
ncbi:MAG: hypothetical protein US63_C0040G0002 [Candidatus Moranbacteria bacterium GW2011_GWC2_37_8]|nr:MAG: hypothetical protein US63_C0040G0002 [Candidatus Moranbacteria bacterium GW2011_GWC2_37_8]